MTNVQHTKPPGTEVVARKNHCIASGKINNYGMVDQLHSYVQYKVLWSSDMKIHEIHLVLAI